MSQNNKSLKELEKEYGSNHLKLTELLTKKDKGRGLTQAEEKEIKIRINDADRLRKEIDELKKKTNE